VHLKLSLSLKKLPFLCKKLFSHAFGNRRILCNFASKNYVQKGLNNSKKDRHSNNDSSTGKGKDMLTKEEAIQKAGMKQESEKTINHTVL
jgi:hypothetical protein